MKIRLLVSLSLLLYTLFWCIPSPAQESRETFTDTAKAILLSKQALALQNEGNYEEAITILNKSIAVKPNPISYYLLSHIYNTQQKYAEAVVNAEKGIKIDPNFTDTYPELFTAYYGAGRWKDALESSERSIKTNGQNLDAQLTYIGYAMIAETASPIMVSAILIVLAISVFYNYFTKKKNGVLEANDDNSYRFRELLLINLAISCGLWAAFFAMASWLRSFNPTISAADFVIYFRTSIYERDGYESFALYALQFLNLLLVAVVSPRVLKINQNNKLHLPVFGLLFAVSACYLFCIGFLPPVSAISPSNFVLPVVTGACALGIYIAYQKNKYIALVAIGLVAAYAGLIAVGPPSETDLAYIVGPALRLYHGFKISEIYFQYDYYLSFIALAFLKLKFDIATFAYLGNVSFFISFIGLLLFGEKYFKTKGLAPLFLLSLIIVRFYCIWSDNPSILQCTPIRLDLWIIPLILAHRNGIRHYSVGIALGLLVIFHRNLGLIYVGAYTEILVALFLVECAEAIKNDGYNSSTIVKIMTSHLKMSLVNIALFITSVGMCFVLFHEFFSPSAIMYRKLGVGMIQIAKNSFYWYLPAVFGSAFMLLLQLKKRLGDRYFNTGFFILFLAIGNSMYFFGRSHENNILNISSALMLTVYMLIDMLILRKPVQPKTITQPSKGNKKDSEPKPKSRSALQLNTIALPLALTMLMTYYYAPRITEKAGLQMDNLSNNEAIQPMGTFAIDTASVKKITNNSDKVYFLDFNHDFYYYYLGGYIPQGYFTPCATWVYRKDYTNFMADLVDKGYYIVYNARQGNRYNEFFPYLHANQNKQSAAMIAFSKQNTPLLFAEKQKPVMHIGIKEPLASIGLEQPPVKIDAEFTIQMLVKPVAPQPSNATLIGNFSKSGGITGFTLQQNGADTGVYLLGYSVGTKSPVSGNFIMESNRWHYLVITANKTELKIYDNGQLKTTIETHGNTLANSSTPVTIGNQITRDRQFNGHIREVSITNGIISTTEMEENAQTILKALPDLK